MKPEGPIPSAKQHATCPYMDPFRTISPHFFKIHET